SFGDLNQHGPDAFRFYTKTKTVTSRWPSGIKDGAEFVIPTMNWLNPQIARKARGYAPGLSIPARHHLPKR
ncbi:MAG: hypothetical protein E5W21_14075, partial [Mesorhizobium sp.]